MSLFDLSQLTRFEEVDCFRLRYDYKNVRGRPGIAANGITNPTLVRAYADGLVAASEFLASRGWRRPEQPFDVYLVDPPSVIPMMRNPFTLPNQRKQPEPEIFLPAQDCDPCSENWLKKAYLDAKHEATHALNYQYRPWKIGEGDWEWLDEATCVFAEFLEGVAKPDWLRWGLKWVNYPEWSLDEQRAQCQGGFLIHYLDRVCDDGFLTRLWPEQRPNEGPLDALSRASGTRTFVSSSPKVADLFASGYCVGSYFVDEMFPEVARRFGGRTVAWWFEKDEMVPSTTPVGGPEDQHLNHLACRYYRMDLPQEAKQLTITLSEDHRDNCSVLKGIVAFARSANGKTTQIPTATTTLEPTGQPGVSPNRTELSATVAVPAGESPDHAVLVVANCGTTRDHDRRSYEFAISVD